MLADKKQELPNDNAIRVVQLTDSHLFEQPGEVLAGLNCQASFDAVVGLVERQQPRIDCIVCTGDLAQDASVAGYRRFNEAVQAFGVPQLWLPGNHDCEDNFRLALGQDSACLEKRQAFGQWQILMLDSSVPGQVHGRLAGAELDFLDRSLAQLDPQGHHVLICVHHNPLPVRASWLQRHALQNSDEFFAVIDRFPHVRCVLWGHVHQEYDGERRGVRMLSSPSTCIQFHPDNDDFTLDDMNPGYRWLDLLPDGNVHTRVERVSGMTATVDFTSSGY